MNYGHHTGNTELNKKEEYLCDNSLVNKKIYKSVIQYSFNDINSINLHHHKDNFVCEKFLLETDKIYIFYVAENLKKNVRLKTIRLYKLINLSNEKEFYIDKQNLFENILNQKYYKIGKNKDLILSRTKADITSLINEFNINDNIAKSSEIA